MGFKLMPSSFLMALTVAAPHSSHAMDTPFTDIKDRNLRTTLRHKFLEKEGLATAPLLSLPADASKRCYFRLPKMLLMDAPPPHENTTSFQNMADLLSQAGLSVPQIYADDHENGFLLIEDFGVLTYRTALEEEVSETMLYEECVNSLIHLHQNVTGNNAALPSYSLELFLKEAEIFLEWYGLDCSAQSQADFRALWTQVYEQQPAVPHSLVMRDVLVDNLMWLPSRTGFQRCGFLDFQDGVWGPVTYDLVSLLEDARRDISPHFGKDMVEIYLKAFPDLNPDNFWASYALWGAQRCTKILGIFSRLSKRDGKSQYLTHLPRVKMILERDLEHPALKELQQWYKGVGI